MPAATSIAPVPVIKMFPLTVNPVSVPTEVRLELTTVLLSVVPVKVEAAAVIVISAEPSKETPFIALAVVKVAAEPVVFWFNVGILAASSVPAFMFEAFL